MRYDAFALSYAAQHRLLLVMLGVLAVMTVALAAMGVALVRREQIVVVAPPQLDAAVAIGRSSAGVDYKRAWALFVAETLGDITPANQAFMRSTLERLVSQPLSAYPNLRAALLTDRNKAWVEIIEAQLAAGRRPLVAVGAGHMLGPQGLPQLLAARGFTVTRLQ